MGQKLVAFVTDSTSSDGRRLFSCVRMCLRVCYYVRVNVIHYVQVICSGINVSTVIKTARRIICPNISRISLQDISTS